jgi:hypothetical protein
MEALCTELINVTIYDPQVRMIDELHLASSKDLHGENYRLQLIVSMKEMFSVREVLEKSTREYFQMVLRLP